MLKKEVNSTNDSLPANDSIVGYKCFSILRPSLKPPLRYQLRNELLYNAFVSPSAA